MLMASDVSVVIPSYNSRETVKECLDSLLAQQSLPREIIVVDSSSDDSPDLIAKYFPMVQMIRSDHRLFPGPARNIGARAAQGAILAFIDADCIASPDWVQRMAMEHAAGHLIVGGGIEVGNPASVVGWAGHLSEFRQFVPLGKSRPMMHVPTCNISYRKTLFDANGGFSSSYYPQEDLLFNYLLYQQGQSVWFNPSIRVRHFCRERLREYLSHQHRIGRVTFCALRWMDLPGATIARLPRLIGIAAPALGALRLARILSFSLKRFPQQLLCHPALTGVLWLGIVWWMRGCAARTKTGLSGSKIRGWDELDEQMLTKKFTQEKFQAIDHGNPLL